MWLSPDYGWWWASAPHMDSTVTGGLIGVGGAVVGALSAEGLTVLRERRAMRRQLKRAVSAIENELLETASILNKALERGAWWPEGDEPKNEEWRRYRDVLAEEVDEATVVRGSILYSTVRSLAATRSNPLTPVSRGPLRRMLRDDPQGRSFFSLIWTDDRWPSAREEVEQTLADVWAFLLECMRPLHLRVFGNGVASLDGETRALGEKPATSPGTSQARGSPATSPNPPAPRL